jgi:hypothetical protein
MTKRADSPARADLVFRVFFSPQRRLRESELDKQYRPQYHIAK